MFIFFTFVVTVSAQGLFGAQGANSLLGGAGYPLSAGFGSISPYGNQLGGGIGGQNIIGGGQTGGLLGNQGLLGGLLGDQGLLGGLLGNQGLLGGIVSPLTSTLNQLLGSILGTVQSILQDVVALLGDILGDISGLVNQLLSPLVPAQQKMLLLQSVISQVPQPLQQRVQSLALALMSVSNQLQYQPVQVQRAVSQVLALPFNQMFRQLAPQQQQLAIQSILMQSGLNQGQISQVTSILAQFQTMLNQGGMANFGQSGQFGGLGGFGASGMAGNGLFGNNMEIMGAQLGAGGLGTMGSPFLGANIAGGALFKRK